MPELENHGKVPWPCRLCRHPGELYRPPTVTLSRAHSSEAKHTLFNGNKQNQGSLDCSLISSKQAHQRVSSRAARAADKPGMCRKPPFPPGGEDTQCDRSLVFLQFTQSWRMGIEPGKKKISSTQSKAFLMLVLDLSCASIHPSNCWPLYYKCRALTKTIPNLEHQLAAKSFNLLLVVRMAESKDTRC